MTFTREAIKSAELILRGKAEFTTEQFVVYLAARTHKRIEDHELIVEAWTVNNYPLALYRAIHKRNPTARSLLRFYRSSLPLDPGAAQEIDDVIESIQKQIG